VSAVLAGVAGGLLAGGVALAVLAWAGVLERPVGAPTRRSQRTARLTASQYRRVAGAVAAGAVVWLATGWVVAGLGAGLGVALLPVMLSRHRAEQVIERLDALAVWTRRLADLLASGAGGLDYALVASARTAPPASRPPATPASTALTAGPAHRPSRPPARCPPNRHLPGCDRPTRC